MRHIVIGFSDWHRRVIERLFGSNRTIDVRNARDSNKARNARKSVL